MNLEGTINVVRTLLESGVVGTYLTAVSGTANRITSSGGTTPVIDISASYVGQSSITTLGTIATGVWNATPITDAKLASSYIYADGTRPLTANWAAGAFSATFNSLILGGAANTLSGGAATTSPLILRSTTGVGTTNADIIFQVGNNGATEAMRILNSGNVGIGINNPTNLFQVVGGTNGSISADVKNTTAGTAALAFLNVFSNTGAVSLQTSSGSFTTSGLQIAASGRLMTSSALTGGLVISCIAAAPVIFGVSNAEVARFSSAGRFGIGQTSPTALIHLKAGTAAASTAPIKLTSGTNLTVVENGTFEYDGTNLYFSTGGVRKTVTLV